MALSFWVQTDELGAKLYLMLREGFDGRAPLCLSMGVRKVVTFLQGRDVQPVIDAQRLTELGAQDITPGYAGLSANLLGARCTE
jgi:hypothetical protein